MQCKIRQTQDPTTLRSKESKGPSNMSNIQSRKVPSKTNANIVEAITEKANVQHMARYVINAEKKITFGQYARPVLCQVEEFEVMTDTDDSIYGVDSIGTAKHINQKRFFVPLCFKEETGNTVIDYQLDTGATCNVMSFQDLCEIKQHGHPQMKPSTTKLKFYDNIS